MHNACPRCHLIYPKDIELWKCEKCGHEWNTFASKGVCPECHYQWLETQCLRCKAWSPHMDWHVEGEPSFRERLASHWFFLRVILRHPKAPPVNQS